MANLYTFAEMARRICEADGRPATDSAKIQEQIRGAQQRGLIAATDHGGSRGAVRVSFEEFCRVRLLLVMIDFGMSGRDLELANSMLTDGGRGVLPDGTSIRHSLSGLIEATQSNRKWVLRVNMLRDRCEGGELRFSAKLMPAWKAAKANEDPTHPEAELTFRGATHLAYLKIPASDLIRPLLGDL